MRVLSVFVLLSVCVGAMITDAMLTSDTQNAVKSSCRTKVAYDKSGDLYCMEVSMRGRN